IAYTLLTRPADGAPRADIMVMDADGKSTRSVGKGILPAWSPDGKRILYTASDPADKEDKGMRLCVTGADGKDAKVLVKGEAMMGAWSPDGKRIAYMCVPEGGKSQPQVHLCNADGSDPKQLTKPGGQIEETGPQWSADGKRVYFGRRTVPKGAPGK